MLRMHRLLLLVLLASVLTACQTGNGPGDGNGDGNGDGDTMPVYEVTKAGATAEQTRQLAEILGIEADLLDAGVIDFFDPERFAEVPTLGGDPVTADEEEQQVVRESINFDALASNEVPSADEVQATLDAALREAQLSTNFPDANFSQQQTVLEVMGGLESPVESYALDTRIALEFALGDDGIPLQGPGAVVYATFDSQGPTSFRYAFRELAAGGEVPVISQEEAQQRCRERLGGDEREMNVSTRTVYYAPPLEMPEVRTILPHVECSGTVDVAGEQVPVLQQLLPAVQSEEYVPSATLEVDAEGSRVTAQVDVSGGTAPYTVEWSSATSSLSDAPTLVDEALQYDVIARESVSEETLIATVTDANGISTRVSQTFAIDATAPAGALLPQVGGVTDFGTENSVTNEFGALEQGFQDEMVADSVVRRFSWTGTNAWEQDFKSPGDSSYIDNTDITFYVGHGYGGGFTFEDDEHDDSRLTDTDAHGDWGDSDLEWLALYSCQVLKDEYGGENYFIRWWDEFDGLHMMLGFHTNAYVRTNFSKKFGDNLVDKNMKVRNAWLKASDDTQPEGVVTRVLGVYGEGGSSVNDHFWGRGSVSADMPGAFGRWSITRTVD